MKSINELIGEQRYTRNYNGNKNINTKQLESDINKALNGKEYKLFASNDNDNIELSILDNLKEGIVGHIIENIIKQQLIKTKQLNISDAKNKGNDVVVFGTYAEVKAFNKDIKNNGTIEHGISFTKRQMEDENPAFLILVQYSVTKNSIKVNNIYCRYPDEVEWSGGKNTSTGRGTVVKIN